MNPDVDSHMARSEKWPDEMAELRPILLECRLTENINWGKPCHGHEGRIIVILQEMKSFPFLMFFKGALMSDPEGVLEEQGPNSRSARRIRFTSVADVARLAHERQDNPANRHLAGDDIRALCALAPHYGFKDPRGPPEMTIAGFVMLAGGLVGFHPSKRQPLPGRRKLWEGVRFLSNAVIGNQVMQEWESKPKRRGPGVKCDRLIGVGMADPREQKRPRAQHGFRCRQDREEASLLPRREGRRSSRLARGQNDGPRSRFRWRRSGSRQVCGP